MFVTNITFSIKKTILPAFHAAILHLPKNVDMTLSNGMATYLILTEVDPESQNLAIQFSFEDRLYQLQFGTEVVPLISDILSKQFGNNFLYFVSELQKI